MARPPSKTPPVSKYGSSVPSLEGLERVVHDVPMPCRKSRPSISSRKSSIASTNKPLPPEPPPPLFATTPSPKSRLHARSQPSSSSRSDPAPSPKTHIKQAGSRVGESEATLLKAERSGGHDSHPTLSALDTSSHARPLSSTATAIIESYAQISGTEPVLRSGTPLIAPHAQTPRTLDMQQERLSAYERFDAEMLSPSADKNFSVDPSNTNYHTMERKDTLAYRFDTPTESSPQIIFNPPIWADDPRPSAEDIAQRYRDTLVTPPYSPTSEYEDDENDNIMATPTIPVLPPIPANSPFRPPLPLTEQMAGEVDGAKFVARRPPNSHMARHSLSSSHEESYRPASITGPTGRQLHRERAIPTRHFGSEASWEPGDDAVSPLRKSSVGTVESKRGTPVSFDMGNTPSLLPADRGRPLPSIYVPSFSATPQLASAPSLERPKSGPSNTAAGHKRSQTIASFVTDIYEEETDNDRPASRFSSDSDDETRARFSPLWPRKRRESNARPPVMRDVQMSPKGLLAASPTLGFAKEKGEIDNKRSAADKTMGLIMEMDHTLRTSLSLKKHGIPATHATEDVHGRRHSGHRSLPSASAMPLPLQTPTGPPKAGENTSERRPSVQKSQTWGTALPSAALKDETGKKFKSAKADSSWLVKMLKRTKLDSPGEKPREKLSQKAEAEREKRRAELKSKIRVVHDDQQPQGMMAFVPTLTMKQRAGLGSDDGVNNRI